MAQSTRGEGDALRSTDRRRFMDRVLRDILALRPTAERRDRECALHLYRLLARGAPVRLEELGAALDRRTADVWGTLQSWPSLVQFDDDQRVVGFGGLTLKPTRHRLRVDGHNLFTWCAWDTLFIPGILNRVVEVASPCPRTEGVVELTVTPDSIVATDPPEPVVSFPASDGESLREDVRGSFCHHVFFLASRDAAAGWLDEHPGLTLLSLGEAFELGQRKNAAQFGDLLGPAPGPDSGTQGGSAVTGTEHDELV